MWDKNRGHNEGRCCGPSWVCKTRKRNRMFDQKKNQELDGGDEGGEEEKPPIMIFDISSSLYTNTAQRVTLSNT